MGQKDHVEAAAGHILDPGLDLEYLHVAGTDRQAGGTHAAPAMEEQGESPGSPAHSPPPADPEPPPSSEGGASHSKNAHQPLCRTQCVDLGTEGPPEPPEPEAEGPPELPADPAPPAPVVETGGKEYRAKLEFALKLGYSEETVRLVLSKLGPDTLINDILGELVKLGTKADGEQPPGSLASTSSSSSTSSSCGCADLLDGQRADSPCPSEALGDQDNLRPVVVDGSNVAMR